MKTNRYIVLLENQAKKSLSSIEKEFSVSVTSSEDLSKNKRSFDIIDGQNAVLYKNLNVVVLDNITEQQLQDALNNSKSPVVGYELEREFVTAGEIELIAELKKNVENVQNKIAELEKFIQNKPIPQQTETKLEWGIKAVGVQNTQFSGKGIDVCILDTGLDISHPDFQNRNIEGKSFIEGEVWDKDPKGHGTHCAGIATGNLRMDNGNRYGVAKDANLKIAKVLNNNGKGSTSSIIDAIDWAITKKFRIVSMSLASPVSINEKPSQLFEEIGKRALENNCLLIAAAGNDSSRPSVPEPVSVPANSTSIMAIAAVDSQLKVAKFSNAGINAATGGSIDICAPGVDIFSSYSIKTKTSPKYQAMSGTSMATPFVSGMAALYMEKFPQKSAKEIWELLEKNAKKIEGLKFRDIGNGLVQIPTS